MLDSLWGLVGRLPETWIPIAAFGLKAGVISAVIVVLDALIVTTGVDSYLQITHGRRTTKFICAWFAGGAIVGVLGSLVQIYEQTVQAAFVVALSWRTFYR
jgi:hypothetical protein